MRRRFHRELVRNKRCDAAGFQRSANHLGCDEQRAVGDGDHVGNSVCRASPGKDDGHLTLEQTTQSLSPGPMVGLACQRRSTPSCTRPAFSITRKEAGFSLSQ